MLSPVPADIDIANSVVPFHISEIAQELNLDPSHYDLYGKYKAKVISISCSVWLVRKCGKCKENQHFCLIFFFHLFGFDQCLGILSPWVLIYFSW